MIIAPAAFAIDRLHYRRPSLCWFCAMYFCVRAGTANRTAAAYSHLASLLSDSSKYRSRNSLQLFCVLNLHICIEITIHNAAGAPFCDGHATDGVDGAAAILNKSQQRQRASARPRHASHVEERPCEPRQGTDIHLVLPHADTSHSCSVYVLADTCGMLQRARNRSLRLHC